MSLPKAAHDGWAVISAHHSALSKINLLRARALELAREARVGRLRKVLVAALRELGAMLAPAELGPRDVGVAGVPILGQLPQVGDEGELQGRARGVLMVGAGVGSVALVRRRESPGALA